MIGHRVSKVIRVESQLALKISLVEIKRQNATNLEKKISRADPTEPNTQNSVNHHSTGVEPSLVAGAGGKDPRYSPKAAKCLMIQ